MPQRCCQCNAILCPKGGLVRITQLPKRIGLDKAGADTGIVATIALNMVMMPLWAIEFNAFLGMFYDREQATGTGLTIGIGRP